MVTKPKLTIINTRIWVRLCYSLRDRLGLGDRDRPGDSLGGRLGGGLELEDE